MSVTEQTPLENYTGDGVTTVFAYNFQLIDQDDLNILVEY